MSLVVACSFTGAPGVTTSVLGLALAWPGDVVVSDCDRDPGQVVEAGYLRGLDLGGRGLAPLARAHRERRSIADEMQSQLVPLREHPSYSRRFLPGFTHPASATVFGPVWPEFVAALGTMSATGTDVVVDAGRVGRDGLPPALLAEADLVVVVLRSNLRSLAAARLHLPALREQLTTLSGSAELALAVVGPGMPYSAGEISAHFALPIAASLTHHPAHASVLTDGVAEPRGFGDGALIRSYRAAAASLASRLRRRDAVLDAGSATEWTHLVPATGRAR
ncbi:MAG: hypothetical protein M0Z51_04285 [Propionibacterium sp.]|nr:hypothetical protein [Propionibacterium sp.]